jgi:hypothetical protein
MLRPLAPPASIAMDGENWAVFTRRSAERSFEFLRLFYRRHPPITRCPSLRIFVVLNDPPTGHGASKVAAVAT